jgi:hypothetical protein
MFQYTKDNHLKIDKNVSIGRCSRLPLSFKQECIEAAKHIASVNDKRIYVAYNNDTTSQVMCLAFLEAGVKFSAVITRMGPNNFNMFNYALAKQFFKNNNIPYKAISINAQYYFTTFAPDITRKHKLPTLESLVFALAQTHLDGILVTSDRLLTFDKQPKYKQKQISDEFRTYSCGEDFEPCSIRVDTNTPFNYYVANELPVIPEFFAYTPELLAAFYTDETVESFIDLQDFVSIRMFDRVIKPMLYKKYWNIEPILRYGGIELIDSTTSYDALNTQFQSHKSSEIIKKYVHIPYNELVDYLTGSGDVNVWQYENNAQFLLNVLKKR